jgi:hypothetical protein
VGNGYAKIYESLFDGSLRGRSDEILVMVNICTHGGISGVADIHHKKIADETGLSIERVKAAALHLESPDTDSRTPNEQGRRIVRLDPHRDWGWRIVNHEKYRNGFSQPERKRELTRERVRKFRERESSGNALHSVTSLQALPNALPASVSGSVQEGVQGKPLSMYVDLPPGFPETVDDAVQQAAFVGCDTVFTETVWNKAVGRGGEDNKGRPIRSFRHHLATEWKYEQDRRGKAKLAGNGNGNAGNASLRDIQNQLRAVREEIEKSPANRNSISFTGKATDLEVAALRGYRKKESELNAKLANY